MGLESMQKAASIIAVEVYPEPMRGTGNIYFKYVATRTISAHLHAPELWTHQGCWQQLKCMQRGPTRKSVACLQAISECREGKLSPGKNTIRPYELHNLTQT